MSCLTLARRQDKIYSIFERIAFANVEVCGSHCFNNIAGNTVMSDISERIATASLYHY
jgi:hypothetical protein